MWCCSYEAQLFVSAHTFYEAIYIMTRPEKSLQFLLLILLFIYKVIFNPDIGLQ